MKECVDNTKANLEFLKNLNETLKKVLGEEIYDNLPPVNYEPATRGEYIDTLIKIRDFLNPHMWDFERYDLQQLYRTVNEAIKMNTAVYYVGVMQIENITAAISEEALEKHFAAPLKSRVFHNISYEDVDEEINELENYLQQAKKRREKVKAEEEKLTKKTMRKEVRHAISELSMVNHQAKGNKIARGLTTRKTV